MPGKKEQVSLQKEVTNQEQWEDLLSSEGVVVVDVYQKWCGPCNAVVSLFRKMRNETGDDLLKLAVAEADSIDALERYRGQCKPCFLFFAGGQLVHVIRGVQGPALVKVIIAELEAEHRVLDGGAERKMIVDPLLAEQAAKERAKSAAEEDAKKKASEEAMSQELEGLGLGLRPVSQGTMDSLTSSFPTAEPVSKEVTVVVIKPDAVQAGKTDEILEKLGTLELVILAHEERTLTENEAREFYKAQEDEDHFENLVKFMSSGPSHVLVVTKGDTGQGVVSEVRSMLGPKDISLAKEESPESLRALYGTDTTMNALHGADSAEMAARELTFFFPDFVVPTVPGTGPPLKVEKTLALIRPEALKEHKDEILKKIQEAGFEVCLQKEVQLSEQQAKDFYKEHEGEPFYDELIAEMTKGPVLALGLAKEEAIQGWRNMLGPKEVEKAKEEKPESLRAQFSSTGINALHGSDSNQSATKELEFFFPREHTLAVIKPDAAEEHKDAIIERLHEAGFQISSEKHMALSREMAAQLYQEHEGKDFYENLLDHMTSGPSTVLLLNREDAIHGLRTLMGPTDPELAREQAPESFRALLGKDILNNAIHGSSSLEHVHRKIEHFFPEVEVKEDGQIVVPEGDQPDSGEGETELQEGEDNNDDESSTGGEGSSSEDESTEDDGNENGDETSNSGEMSEEHGGHEEGNKDGKGQDIQNDELVSRVKDRVVEGEEGVADRGKEPDSSADEVSQNEEEGNIEGHKGGNKDGKEQGALPQMDDEEVVGKGVNEGSSGLVDMTGEGDEQSDSGGENTHEETRGESTDKGEEGRVRDDKTSLGEDDRQRGDDDLTGTRDDREEGEADSADQPTSEKTGEEDISEKQDGKLETEGKSDDEQEGDEGTTAMEDAPPPTTEDEAAIDVPAPGEDAPDPEDTPAPNDDAPAMDGAPAPNDDAPAMDGAPPTEDPADMSSEPLTDAPIDAPDSPQPSAGASDDAQDSEEKKVETQADDKTAE